MIETVSYKNDRICNDDFMNEMNWDDLRLFLAVANAGGLSGAVEATGLSAPTLGRRMFALEDSVGRDLFVRHAKGYSLTPHGEGLLAQVTGVAGQIGTMAEPDRLRPVKISAGLWTTRLLCRNANDLMPDGIALRFIGVNEVLDIAHREAVIGIRNQRPSQIGLAMRRVLSVQFARYGATDTPWVQVVGSTQSAAWVKANAPSGTIEVTNPTHALDLALSGVAQAVLPTFIGDSETNLKRQSGDISDLTHDRWVVSHETDRFRPDVRQVIDRLVALLTR